MREHTQRQIFHSANESRPRVRTLVRACACPVRVSPQYTLSSPHVRRVCRAKRPKRDLDSISRTSEGRVCARAPRPRPRPRAAPRTPKRHKSTHKMCAAKPNLCERPYRIYTRARQLIANTNRPRRHYHLHTQRDHRETDMCVCRARVRANHIDTNLSPL